MQKKQIGSVLPVTVTLPPGARAKKTAKVAGVQPGATMPPEVISIMPGSGRSLVGTGKPAPPVPSSFADYFAPDAEKKPVYDPSASLSETLGLLFDRDTPRYDPNNSPFAPVDDAPAPALVYQPNYRPAPARPQVAALPPAPVRDAAGEKKQRENAARVAGLVPLMTMLFGGSGANVTTALGRALGLMVQAGRGADAGAKSAFEQAMDTYQVQGANTQASNQNLLAEWQAEVQAANDANRQETDRARLSRNDRDAALLEQRNRERVAAAQIKAMRDATQATARERGAFVTQLQSMDDATQQRIIGMAEASGDLARLGIPATRGDDGRYTFTVRKAPPVRDIAVEEQKKQDAASKDRVIRLRGEVSQLLSEYRDDHTTEPRRRVIEARLGTIKQAVPGAYSGAVPTPGSRARFTPQQGVSNNNAAVSLELSKRREARIVLQKEARTKGVPLTVETVTGGVVRGARGVNLINAPAPLLDALEGAGRIATGANGVIPTGERDAYGDPVTVSAKSIAGFKVVSTGKDAKGHYADFALPRGATASQYKTLTLALQKADGVQNSQNVKAFFVPDVPVRGYTAGGKVRVMYGAGGASPSPRVPRSAPSTVPIAKGNPANLSKQKKPAPVYVPSPRVPSKILSIERLK